MEERLEHLERNLADAQRRIRQLIAGGVIALLLLVIWVIVQSPGVRPAEAQQVTEVLRARRFDLPLI